MTEYDPKRVEAKWQARWEDSGTFRAGEADAQRRRFYCLEMLPYPSGRLHMGHVRNYAIGDAIARFRSMCGEKVLHAIGWDAFGLPAENAAIQKGEDPAVWTRRNIETMRAQMRRLGLSYDWTRELATCDPDYYRWNQWFFLKMLERGAAYRAKRPLNWCESCATVLANEQVAGGRCWRCESPVIRREFDQWFFRITDYAAELVDRLDGLEEWPEKVRLMQRNWIGRSGGTRILFEVEAEEEPVEIFTTRLDTIHGATYVALAIEHPAIDRLVRGMPEEGAVKAFVREQMAKTIEDRFGEAAEKLGVFTGRYAVNPYSGARIPIWVANFVLMDVGTGAIMSVPAHDDRDFAFARKYGLPIRPVVRPEKAAALDPATMAGAFTEDGIVHDSGEYSGLTSEQARRAMTAVAERDGFGSSNVIYRLKDWGISRQRYWGTPIPVVYCERCGVVGLPVEALPVLLPENVPLTGEGGSPLARVPEFVHTSCPRCGGPARRETDTMDTFVDSSWYYFRYADPRNEQRPFDWERAGDWFPVDLYIGGIEHAALHLIYTRYWTKMMRDLGLVTLDEPVRMLFTQGMVIKDGAKMSKSKGNIVDPDQMIERYGADTTRLFMLFAAPPERDLEWSEAGVEGCFRFLSRVWRTYRKAMGFLSQGGDSDDAGALGEEAVALKRKTHKTIRRVSDDLGPRMHLNTAVAAIMELINAMAPLADRDELEPGCRACLREAFDVLARLLVPFAPHFAEELWEGLGGSGLAVQAPWPEADPAWLIEDEVTLVVQVNGKLRSRLTLLRGASEADAMAACHGDAKIAAHLEGRNLVRVVYVPDRLLNLVVS